MPTCMVITRFCWQLFSSAWDVRLYTDAPYIIPRVYDLSNAWIQFLIHTWITGYWSDPFSGNSCRWDISYVYFGHYILINIRTFLPSNYRHTISLKLNHNWKPISIRIFSFVDNKRNVMVLRILIGKLMIIFLRYTIHVGLFCVGNTWRVYM
jgi:hypothetical protein